ncbi:MAG: hypothetical protein ABIP17_08370 [Ilumatobacteraceae bacterium]
MAICLHETDPALPVPRRQRQDHVGRALYWPESSKTEINGDGWREVFLLLELTEDPDWEWIDEAEADIQIAKITIRR